MVFRNQEIFICSDTNPLFQRIINLNMRPDDVVPFPTRGLENILSMGTRAMAVRIRMENYMKRAGYSNEEIQRICYPVSREGRLCRRPTRRPRRPVSSHNRFVWRCPQRTQETPQIEEIYFSTSETPQLSPIVVVSPQRQMATDTVETLMEGLSLVNQEDTNDLNQQDI